MNNDNPISALFQSTQSLYDRFHVKPDQHNTTMVFIEEAKEFVEAGKYDDIDDLLGEGADVIVTVIGKLIAHGATPEMLNDALVKVIAKNDAKTHDTHYINGAGKVARKGPKS